MNRRRRFYAVLLLGFGLTGVRVAGHARTVDGMAPLRGLTASASPKQDHDPGRKTGKTTSVDVSGEWKVMGTKREDPDPRELTLLLKQQGDTFSGTLVTNNGRFEVKDGKVKGVQVTFSIDIPQSSTTAACSGSVDGDTFKATCKMPNSTVDLVGSRHK